jgi:beta-glucuronidase
MTIAVPRLLLLPLVLFLATTPADRASAAEEEGGLALFGARSADLPPAPPLMTNVAGRERVSLNGAWNVIVDEHDMGAKGLFGGAYYEVPSPATGMELVEHSFDPRRQLQVPGDWNTQDDRLFRYRNAVWYQRTFDLAPEPGRRYFIHFDGANYTANVWLNGRPLGSHRGGYTAFNVEATEALVAGSNYLVVKVDATLDDSTIPTLRTSDFFKYGGITRDVHLVAVPETFIRQYHVFLDDLERRSFRAWVQLDGPQAADRAVSLSVAGQGIAATARTDADGRAEFAFEGDLALWSPEDPVLHELTLGSGGHTLSDRIGFRAIEVRGGEILLNGEPVFLRGISMHDESVLKRGVAHDRADAEAQLGLVKELNGNFVRLAHYPHNEHTLRVADELGLMVWSEVPIVSLIDWGNPDTLEIALSQVTDNLQRDLNRASIAMWSVANESMPQTPERLAFLGRLAQRARALDLSGRPVASALVGNPMEEFNQVIARLVAELLRDPEITDPAVRAHLQGMAAKMIDGDPAAVLDREIEVMLRDPLGEIVDIVGYNEYFGWYYSAFLSRVLPVDEGTTRRTMLKIMNDIRFRNAFGKPIIISEFGAGAKKGYVSDKGPGMIWSEEYQALVYEKQLDMLRRNDQVRGMSPWVLKDFRSAMRNLNGIQEIYNRKGLVSEKGEKKKAFFVLQDFYRERAADQAAQQPE